MKEKEFREKLAGLYTGVPTDTHTAFEHALTHHRDKKEQTFRVGKVRFALALVLILALLATGAYAVYIRYSVTDYMRNTSKTFLEHMITLNERYENDLFTMTVNDLIFDGSNFAVTMNIDRHSEDVVYFMRTKVTAICAGKDYMVDVEGWQGPDFLAGGMWPQFDDISDPVAIEQRGFGFEGVLWDWDMNPPPAGQPIDWTMTFTVFKPLYEIVVDNNPERDPNFSDTIEQRCLEAWENHQIFMYYGDANAYIACVEEALGLFDQAPEESIPATGAFELADVITFHFTTDFDDDVVKEELIGQRYELGEYAVVIDTMEASFQRISGRIHFDFGREMSEEELEVIRDRLPSRTEIICRNAEGEEVERSTATLNMIWTEEETWQYVLIFSFWPQTEDIASMTFQGYGNDPATDMQVRWDDFAFTVELT